MFNWENYIRDQSCTGVLHNVSVCCAWFLQQMDDLMIRRFLRARDLDIEKASALFLKFLSWRRTFVPKGFISESDIENQLSHNKLCMQGLDKKGRPIVIAFGGRHKPEKGTLEDFKRLLTYPKLFLF